MIIGVPKEIKSGESRVALVPAAVAALVKAGNPVRIEACAGIGAGFPDAVYQQAGATIVTSAAAAFDAELVVKVKEIQDGEWQHMRPGGILFSFLHLGADPTMARALLDRRITGIAFETVADARGGLPILQPMSTIAGELSIPIAATLLTLPLGRRGLLMRDASTLVVGAGAAGTAAARAALALGSRLTVVAASDRRLAPLRAEFGDRVRTLLIAEARLPSLAADADVLVGAVNVPGGATPKLLSIAEVAGLQPGSVLIEICIDGGGIAATSRPTSHAAPTYVEQGVIHYCVPNMPAAAPRSASTQLSAALLGTLQSLCSLGLLRAMRDDDGLAAGLQMHGGQITRPDVAAQLGLPFLDVDAMLFSC